MKYFFEHMKNVFLIISVLMATLYILLVPVITLLLNGR